MPQTYVPINSQTVSGSSTNTITFSSLSSGYTDLVIIGDYDVSTTTALGIRFNSDTASNYSYTGVYGNGTSAASARASSATRIYLGDARTSNRNSALINIMNYSNSTTNKTLLNAHNNQTYTERNIGLWRSTATITSIVILLDAGNFTSGSIFTLYGIKAA